jgi:3-oxoacyl-[acyl-carrier-protein] synthase-3
MLNRKSAQIRAIATYLPEQILTNEQLAREYPDWAVEKIHDKTGISRRGMAASGETALDLAIRACEKLFEAGACSREQIDFILLCTQSPDYFLPTTACLLQTRLGISTRAGALDFNLGCSGYVYGLSLAKGLIETGAASNVLLVTSETYSKYLNPADRSVRTIFSDGAAATWVGAVDSDQDLIGPFAFGTDGRGADNLIVPAGGHRLPIGSETGKQQKGPDGICRSSENLYMNGPEIFNFTLQAVPQLVSQLLERSGKSLDQVDLVIPHQANRFMLEQIRKKMKLSAEKFYINLESYGNTVSSTIPMAMELAFQEGRISSGSSLVLVGFGVGYSYGACHIVV